MKIISVKAYLRTYPGHCYSRSVNEIVEGRSVLVVDQLPELRQQREFLVRVQQIAQADDQLLYRQPPCSVIRQQLRERGSFAPREDDSRLLLHHGGSGRRDGVNATPVPPLVRAAPLIFEKSIGELNGTAPGKNN